MKVQLKKGSTSNILQIFIADSSSTTGAGLTGLVYNTASLTAYYHRDTDTTATAITLATMTVGTFTSSGFKEIDATNMPGWYQFCPPNAAVASGAASCAFHLKGATNMAPLPLEVELVAYDPQDTVRLGLTALPNAAADAAGGLVISDAGGLDIDDLKADINTIDDFLDTEIAALTTNLATANTNINTIDDFLDTEIAAIKAKTDNLPASPANEATLTTIASYIDTEVAAIKAKTDNLPADPADASDIVSSFTTVNSKLDAIDDLVDTEVAAIKTVVDGIQTDLDNGTDGLGALKTLIDNVDNFVDTEVTAIKGVTDKLDTALELDGAVYRYTTNALEQAPSGGGGGATAAAIADAVWDERIDDHTSDRSFGMKIGIHLPVQVPDISYRKIKEMVDEVVKKLESMPQPEKVDLIPVSEGLQAVIAEIRDLPKPKDPEKTDYSPILQKLTALSADIKAIKIPEQEEVDLTPILDKIDEAPNSLRDMIEQMSGIVEGIRGFFSKDVEDIKAEVGSIKKDLKKIPMIVMAPQAQEEEKKSVLDEYLKS